MRSCLPVCVLTLASELRERGGRYGVAGVCVRSGQGSRSSSRTRTPVSLGQGSFLINERAMTSLAGSDRHMLHIVAPRHDHVSDKRATEQAVLHHPRGGREHLREFLGVFELAESRQSRHHRDSAARRAAGRASAAATFPLGQTAPARAGRVV